MPQDEKARIPAIASTSLARTPPPFDVALQNLLVIRDTLATGIADQLESHKVLQAECDALRSQITRLNATLAAERTAFDSLCAEWTKISTEKESIEAQLKNALASFATERNWVCTEKAVILAEKESLGVRLDDTIKAFAAERRELQTVVSGLHSKQDTLLAETESLAAQLKDALRTIHRTAEVTPPLLVKCERKPETTDVAVDPKAIKLDLHEPLFSLPANPKKRARATEDIKLKEEEAPVKFPKLTSRTRMVEVVITRHPRRPKSTANTESATAAGPDPKTKARNRTPNLAQGSTTPMNRPTVPFFTQYHHLFDLGTLPPRPRPTLITQYIPGFDLMTLPPKPTPAAALPQLVTRHQNLFDLSTLKLRRPPRVLPEEPKPLLSAPIFRECIWTTEFFQKSLSLKPLLQDESLTAYWPFIERLNNLNDSGIPRAPESRVAPQFRNTIFFDEDPDLRTVNVNLASFSYSWGCVLRFQLLDMLLRCKGYKQATTTGLNGNTVPQGSNQFICKLYKGQQYLLDCLINAEAHQPQQLPLDAAFRTHETESDSTQAYKNVFLATVSIMLILEEETLPSQDSPAKTFALSSIPNFITRLPSSVKVELPETMSTAAVYRHLGVFLFLSPLCALQNLDLESSSVSTQILFVTSRALGSVKSIVLDRHEMFIRGVVRALMSDPSLGVAGAFLVAGDRPRYVPPPYLETFFDAGVPHLALRR